MPEPEIRTMPYDSQLTVARNLLSHALTGNSRGAGNYIGYMSEMGKYVALYLVGNNNTETARQVALTALRNKVSELRQEGQELNRFALGMLSQRATDRTTSDIFTYWFVQGAAASGGGKEVRESMKGIIFDLHQEVFER
ncbi:MAG: hypothetical protein QY312_03125 [Candidatus Dojkabacteria bacterium]|nr:MAG: hypothetical protein QY312_03125 [Candidatus Dojkabacteria bacterium]